MLPRPALNSSCNPCWSLTCDPPAPASQRLRLQMCATILINLKVITFYSMSYDPPILLFFPIAKSSLIWPVRSLLIWLLCPSDMFPLFFDLFYASLDEACIGQFFCCLDKMPDICNLKEGRFNLTHDFTEFCLWLDDSKAETC